MAGATRLAEIRVAATQTPAEPTHARLPHARSCSDSPPNGEERPHKPPRQGGRFRSLPAPNPYTLVTNRG